ncbi:MAG: class I SAM-dependent methyltransferase [Candidatus Thorarchaeota archaeon]
MENNKQHYYSEFPDVKVKIHTISESLKKHLYIFKTITGVFSFRKIDLGTKILIENIVIPEEPSVLLDLGCGYGPIGIVLGYELPQSLVYLIDINKRAIWCAKENIKINLNIEKKRIRTLQGNYFEPIKNKNIKFDEIYMNPPMRQGRKDFLKLIEDIPNYLKSKGSFQFVIKKKMGAPHILNYIKKNYPNNKIEVICKRSGYWVFRFFQVN